MNTENSTSNPEKANLLIPILMGFLTIFFSYQKISGEIDWSWWRILAPIWIVALFFLWHIVLAIICWKK